LHELICSETIALIIIITFIIIIITIIVVVVVDVETSTLSQINEVWSWAYTAVDVDTCLPKTAEKVFADSTQFADIR
jgi:amino acid transporter